MVIEVKTKLGHLGQAEPTALRLGTLWVDVLEIIDRWFSSGQTWFKVDSADGQLYVLRHQLHSDEWDLAAMTRRDG